MMQLGTHNAIRRHFLDDVGLEPAVYMKITIMTAQKLGWCLLLVECVIFEHQNV